MKDELGEKIMERPATLRAESKNIQFFTDSNDEEKKI